LSQFGVKNRQSAIDDQNFWTCFSPNDALFSQYPSPDGYLKHTMSIDFGNRLKAIRSEKGLKREELAKLIGTSAAIIGRYERDERTPSVDIAKNIAEALGVSLDYLVGDATVLIKDKKMIYRIEMLQKINPTYKDRILYMLDLMLKDAQNNSLQERLG
jgi:transcriptional regulator with XRE-family HTH domain